MAGVMVVVIVVEVARAVMLLGVPATLRKELATTGWGGTAPRTCARRHCHACLGHRWLRAVFRNQLKKCSGTGSGNGKLGGESLDELCSLSQPSIMECQFLASSLMLIVISMIAFTAIYAYSQQCIEV
eukprot:6177080-Pleurochrysis_carterae.AAC.4